MIGHCKYGTLKDMVQTLTRYDNSSVSSGIIDCPLVRLSRVELTLAVIFSKNSIFCRSVRIGLIRAREYSVMLNSSTKSAWIAVKLRLAKSIVCKIHKLVLSLHKFFMMIRDCISEYQKFVLLWCQKEDNPRCINVYSVK